MYVIGAILFVLYALAQLVAAYVGMEAYIGGWALLAIGACFFLRFTLPLTIFAFLGAKNGWDWHWLVALIFVAPGLLTVVPAIGASLLGFVQSSFSKGRRA